MRARRWGYEVKETGVGEGMRLRRWEEGYKIVEKGVGEGMNSRG